MKPSLRFTFPALLLALVLISACSSPTEVQTPETPITISPDVLNLDVQLGQVRNEPYMLVELTNASEQEITQTELLFRYWRGSTQVYDEAFTLSGPVPGTTVRDSVDLALLDDLSEFECYTYQLDISPTGSRDRLTEMTSKTYPGTCPSDHPSL